MFKQGLEDIIRGKDLSQETMSQMITEILSGTITHAQIGAFMGALSTKGETYQELIGAARAMRRKAKRIQTTSSVVLDTCGTGGDLGPLGGTAPDGRHRSTAELPQHT